MKSRICRIIMTAGAYTAAFAGGGFASGKEISEFFVRYGARGAVAVIVSAAIFGAYAYAVLEICRLRGCRTSVDLTNTVFGKGVGRFVQLYICLFSAVIFGAMVSAAGETAWMCFGINRAVAGIFICLLVSAFVMTGIRSIALWEGILGIVSAIGIILICRYVIHYRLIGTFSAKSYIQSGVSYTGYNLLGTTAVLCGMSRYIKSRLESACTAVLAFLILLLMMGMMWLTINIFYDKISLGSIPMLTITMRMGSRAAVLYSILIAISIFTTAISAAYGISDTFSQMLNAKKRAYMIFAAGIIIGSIRFDIIVERLYYWMGIFGFVIIAYIYIYFPRRRKCTK